MAQRPNTDLGILRVKTDDPDNLHCNTRQELTLVARTLVQQAIIVS